MLKKINRLPKTADLRGGREFSSIFFRLKTSKNSEEFSRFGFVISKKIDKRAVIRNKIKRKMSFCIEKNIDKITRGVDMLFLTKKEIVGKTINEICFDIEEALKKEKLLK